MGSLDGLLLGTFGVYTFEFEAQQAARTRASVRDAMTGSLLAAWGAAHAAQPGVVLEPGAHGPAAAFGLETPRLGGAEAGAHEVDGASARRR